MKKFLSLSTAKTFEGAIRPVTGRVVMELNEGDGCKVIGDGQQFQIILERPKTIAYLYGGQGTINVPSWLPDSKQLAFVSNYGVGRD